MMNQYENFKAFSGEISVSDALILASVDFHTFALGAFMGMEGKRPDLGWYLLCICSVLTDVAAGREPRLLLAMPPRALKSFLVSVALPAWILGNDPSKKIMCVSYGLDLAADLHDKFMALVSSPYYRAVFPQAAGHVRHSREYVTDCRGFRMGLSLKGAVTGKGCDLLIVDDPIKADDADSDAMRKGVNSLFAKTLFTRINNRKTGGVIIAMHRLHADDLIGHVMKLGLRWKDLSFPARFQKSKTYEWNDLFGDQRYEAVSGEILRPEREGEEELQELEASLGTKDFHAQYLQAPLSPDAPFFNGLDLPTYDPAQLELTGLDAFISIDTANTEGERSSYTAIVEVGLRRSTGELFILNVERGRWSYPELKNRVSALRQKRGSQARFLIERAGNGLALLQEVGASLNLHGITPKGSKEERLQPHLRSFQENKVLVPSSAGWLSAFLAELSAFPHGQNTDQVDALSQALDAASAEAAEPGILQWVRLESEKMDKERR